MSDSEVLQDIHARLRSLDERELQVANDIATIKTSVHSPSTCPELLKVNKRLDGQDKRITNLRPSGGMSKRALAAMASGAAVLATTVAEIVTKVWPK